MSGLGAVRAVLKELCGKRCGTNEPGTGEFMPKQGDSCLVNGAEEGIRTPDPLLGKEMLYH